MLLQRFLLPIGPALLTTAALFLMMYGLIYQKPAPLLIPALPEIPPYAHEVTDESLIIDKLKKHILVPDAKKPKTVKLSIQSNDDVIRHPIPTLPPPTGNTTLVNPDTSQLVLLFGYPPHYPRFAEEKNIQGYVIVEFSVNKLGEVFNAIVTESQPRGIFDRSALKAIARFRYQPKTINGDSIIAHGQQYLFRYELES